MAQFLFPYSCAAVFGLIFGSFLNVCISRLPQHESIVTPRSHCPRCNNPIQWYDNIPVLSYFILGGRCRHCHERISIIYPMVELLTAALWVGTLAEYELSPEFIKYVLLGMLLLVLIFTDLRWRIIPHSVTIFGISAGLLLSFLVPVDNRPLAWALGFLGFYPTGLFDSFLGALAGALVGGGLFYAVGEAFYYSSGRTKEYLGFGDVMLMLMAGTFLGVPLTLMTILLGSLGGTLVAAPATLLSSRLRDYEWPYGTFLGIAAIFSILGGPALLDWYLRWSGIV
jgi:leader peptidase (prepilin peptidase) / N-methyltransferase